MKKILLFTALIIPLLAGCKKDPPDPVDEYTMEERARDGLYDLMQTVYLWYNYIPTVKVTDYPGPDEILDAIRYKPRDRWSFVISWEDYLAMKEGTFVGHGIRMGLDSENNVRVVSLYTGSDLWPGGVRRGWIVKTVNGTPIAPIFISGDDAAYNTLLGPSTAGVTNSFTFQRPDGTEVTYSSTKATFTINSVSSPKILDLATGKTGYFAFDTFIEPSEQELDNLFADFKSTGITDLIIDLRYNTGGFMNIAEQLSSLVMEAADTTKLCYSLKYNDLVAPDWDQDYNFVQNEQSSRSRPGGIHNHQKLGIRQRGGYKQPETVYRGRNCRGHHPRQAYRDGRIWISLPLTDESQSCSQICLLPHHL